MHLQECELQKIDAIFVFKVIDNLTYRKLIGSLANQLLREYNIRA